MDTQSSQEQPPNVLFFFDTCAQTDLSLSGLLDRICEVNKSHSVVRATLGITDMLVDEAGFVSPLLLTETTTSRSKKKFLATLNEYSSSTTIFDQTPFGKKRLGHVSKKFLETDTLPVPLTLEDLIKIQKKFVSYKGKDLPFQEDRGEISILQTLLLNNKVPDNSIVVFITKDKRAANAFKRLSRNELSDKYPLDAEVLAAMQESTDEARRARIDLFNQTHRIVVWDNTRLIENSIIQAITGKSGKNSISLKLSPSPKKDELIGDYFSHCSIQTLGGYLEACLTSINAKGVSKSCLEIQHPHKARQQLDLQRALRYGER